MYGLKRTILFFVAASFLAGFAVDTFAQTFADPQGVRIRVNKDAEWVKIGEEIEVKVLTRGITLEEVVVSIAAPADTTGETTLSSAGALLGSGTGALNAGGRNPVFTGHLSSDGTSDGGDADADDTGVSTANITTTFKFTFPVEAGDAESDGMESLMVQVFVQEQGQTDNAFKALHNQMTAVQESEVFTDKVGDGRMFGVDGQRPVNGTTSSTPSSSTARGWRALETRGSPKMMKQEALVGNRNGPRLSGHYSCGEAGG